MISDLIKKHLDSAIQKGFSGQTIGEYTIEHPSLSDHGDYATNIALLLAKKVKKNPRDVAQQIAAHLDTPDFEKVEVAGPGFINVFLNKQLLAAEIESLTAKPRFDTEKKKIMIEYAQPNTNKPQHVGHMRNAIYGKSVGKILQFVGHNVIFVNYMGDVGVHIMKSMLAYMKWGDGKTPADENMKPDHFVGKYYVMFTQKAGADPKLLEEAQELLLKWEAGDTETRALWKKMNAWAYEGWKVTFERMGVSFDHWYYESTYTDAGKKIAQDALKKGVAYEEPNGAIAIDLEKWNLGKKVLLRGDGTAVYMTKELALFRDNYADHKMDLRLYVVGSDQEHYFRQFFKILELLGHEYGTGGTHLSYGMVYTQDGKMSSRAGTVINADDMLDLAHQLAEKEIDKRHVDIDQKQRDATAEAIGVGALKYAMLKVDAKQDLTFDPNEAVSFEGNTGPYLQYTHARIHSIFRKIGGGRDGVNTVPTTNAIDASLLTEPDEVTLLRTLYQFPEVIHYAALEYKPHLLCNFLFDLSQKFNTFYANVTVLKAPDTEKKARLALLVSIANVLKTGLNLLGIDALERM